MNEEEKLQFFLEKLEIIAKENLTKENTSAIEALKKALNYIEGKFIGY